MNQWIIPPEFLYWPEEQWPKSHIDSEGISVNDPEVKRVTVRTVLTSQNDCTSTMTDFFERHSSWYLLKRSVAWILRVRAFLLQNARYRKGSETLSSQDKKERDSKPNGLRLSVADMDKAEKAILKVIQREVFLDEISALESGLSQVKKKSSIRNLDPILDDGLLRVGGRLHRANMPMESKHQIILPKDHHVSELILRKIHIDLMHSGRNHMLACLRQKYWLINAPSGE